MSMIQIGVLLPTSLQLGTQILPVEEQEAALSIVEIQRMLHNSFHGPPARVGPTPFGVFAEQWLLLQLKLQQVQLKQPQQQQQKQ
jgi:hypothetical protein